MNFNLLLPLVITSLVTMLGWYFLHRLTKERDLLNRQKELRINYLIQAWRKLEYATNRSNIDNEEYLEKPLADIQLFGTKKQIQLAHSLAIDIVQTQNADLTPLLNELRKDLRKELKLNTELPDIRIFRAPNQKKTTK